MKRALSMAIALVLILSLLMGCQSDNGTSPKTGDQTNDMATEDGQTTSADNQVKPDLPDVKYDGYEFKIYQRGPNADEWKEVCIWSDGETGEPLNDAVYKRNMYLEEKYNIKIVPVNGSGSIVNGDIKKDFVNSVMAGDNMFDMAMMGVLDSASLAMEGHLVDLYNVPHIDLSKPWWDVPVNETITIMDKLYFGISKMGVHDKDDSFVILFNKQLVSDLGIENPYQIVKDNRWTYDTFISLAKQAVSDLNGNGEFDDDDRYGYSGFNAEAWNNFFATGERIAKIGEDGKPVITMVNERSQRAYEYIYKLFNNDNIMLNTQKFPGETLHDVTYQLLSNKQVLFAGAAMTVVQKARAMEQDFGMLPYPKLDKNQDKYYTMCGLWGPTAITIPKTNQDLDRTGVLIEAMVAESMNTVYPAYYDINLVTKGLRDEESKEMLDLIMEGRGFDIGMLFSWGDLSSVLINSLLSKNESLVSAFEKREKAAQAAMEKTIENFENVAQ